MPSEHSASAPIRRGFTPAAATPRPGAMRIAITVALAAAVAGCAARAAPPAPAVPVGWRAVATDADRARLRRWREAWLTALAAANRSGAGAQIGAQGALFDPDHALADPIPPAGEYRCRVFKLGAKSRGLLDYVPYPWFACTVAREGERVSFTKRTGSQRQVGLILPHEPARAVFLGTLLLGDETRTVDYGRDPLRDQAGWVERVGAQRWRIAMPYPRFESTIDVMELVPAA